MVIFWQNKIRVIRFCLCFLMFFSFTVSHTTDGIVPLLWEISSSFDWPSHNEWLTLQGKWLGLPKRRTFHAISRPQNEPQEQFLLRTHTYARYSHPGVDRQPKPLTTCTQRLRGTPN